MAPAVVFDLWQTLATWPEAKSAELRRWWAESLGIAAETLDESWYGDDLYRMRETGPIEAAISTLYSGLGVDGDVRELLARRRRLTLEALEPVPGADSTLQELRRRGIPTGLVSNCTEEVALVWEESSFARLIDVTVFSATAGCMKPESRIYELVLSELGVPARETLFVGDGANDELEGARRSGMTPVLVHPPGGEPPWEGLAGWTGLRVTSIPQVLELVG